MKPLISTALLLALVLSAAPSHAARPSGSKLHKTSPSPIQKAPSSATSFTEVPEVEPNDAREQAQVFACGNMLRPATIGHSGDADFVTFTVAPGHWIVARTEDDPNAGGPQAGDLMLTLYDGAGAEIAFNDDWCPDFHSRLVYRSVSGGTYYLAVTPYDELIVGAYQISVDCPDHAPPANDVCAGAQWIECGPIALQGDNTFASDDMWLSMAGCGNSSGSNSGSGGDLFYAIQATGGDVLQLTGVGFGDLLLYVTDACGAPVGACFGMVEGGCEDPAPVELQVTFEQSGLYHLVVDSYLPEVSGAFTLTGSLDCHVVPANRSSWGSLKSYYR